MEQEPGPFPFYRAVSTKYYFSGGGLEENKNERRDSAETKAVADGNNVYFSCEVFVPTNQLELMPGDYFHQGRYAVIKEASCDRAA